MPGDYKNSGVEWIGDIPVCCDVIKFKQAISATNSGEVIDKNYWNDGDELLYTCQKTPMKSTYYNFPAHKRTEPGDLLLTRNATPYIFIPEPNSIYSNVVQRVKIHEGYFLHYLRYAVLLGAEALVVNGNTIPSYNMEVWRNISIPMYPYQQQQRIADYLDAKCLEIENVLEQTRNTIEEYKHLKQAIIYSAVTKGVLGDRELQESGVEWLGTIPKGWKVRRVANLYDERSESGLEELPILTVSINSGVSDHEIADEDKDRVFVRSEDRTKYKRVYPGDLAYNMMRAWQGAFGAVRVDGMVSPAYVVAKPKPGVQLDSRYMEALLRTPAAIEEMHRYSRGIVDFRLRLYWPEFKNIRICLPPLEEQTEIADYIDQKSAELDALIAKKEQFLAELENYKKSLIYEYVTGKKEVQ